MTTQTQVLAMICPMKFGHACFMREKQDNHEGRRDVDAWVERHQLHACFCYTLLEHLLSVDRAMVSLSSMQLQTLQTESGNSTHTIRTEKA